MCGAGVHPFEIHLSDDLALMYNKEAIRVHRLQEVS